MMKPTRRGFLSGALFSGLAMTVPFKLLPQEKLIVEPTAIPQKGWGIMEVGLDMALSKAEQIPLRNLTLPREFTIMNPIEMCFTQELLEVQNMGDAWSRHIPTGQADLSLNTYFSDDVYNEWFQNMHSRKETTIALQVGGHILVAQGHIRSLVINQAFEGW